MPQSKGLMVMVIVASPCLIYLMTQVLVNTGVQLPAPVTDRKSPRPGGGYVQCGHWEMHRFFAMLVDFLLG